MIFILDIIDVENMETPLDYEIAKGELRMKRLFATLEFYENLKALSVDEEVYLEDASLGMPLDFYMEARDKVAEEIQKSELKEKNLLATIWKELKSLIEKLIDAIKNKNYNVKITPDTKMRISGKEVHQHGLIRGLFKTFGKVIGNPITFPLKIGALIIAIGAVLAGRQAYKKMKKVSDIVTMPKRELDKMRKEKLTWLDKIKEGVSKLTGKPGELDAAIKNKKGGKDGKNDASEKSLAGWLQKLTNHVSKSVDAVDNATPDYSAKNHAPEDIKKVNASLEKRGLPYRFVPGKKGGTYKVSVEKYNEIMGKKKIKKKVDASVKETEKKQKEAEVARKQQEAEDRTEKAKAIATQDEKMMNQSIESGKKEYGTIKNKNGETVNLDKLIARNRRLREEHKRDRWILDNDGNPVKTQSPVAFKEFGQKLKAGFFNSFNASADLTEEELLDDFYLETEGNWWD